MPFFRMPNGDVAHVKMSGVRKTDLCSVCGFLSDALCDYKPAGSRATCSKPLCSKCAVYVESNQDFCPHHPGAAMTLSLFQSDRTRERIAEVSRLDFQPRPLSNDERRVLALLGSHMGAARAIPIHRICEHTTLSDRAVKEIIATLRRTPFCVPISSSRDGKTGGIFLAETGDERREAAERLLNQAFSEIRTAQDILEPGEFHTATAPLRQLVTGDAR